MVYTTDVEGRIFILIAERTYPVRAAHACLEEFQRSVRHIYIYININSVIATTPSFADIDTPLQHTVHSKDWYKVTRSKGEGVG